MTEQVKDGHSLRGARRRALVEANETGAGDPQGDPQDDYPRDQGVHQLFEAQVERRPQRIAASYQGNALSYAELNASANALAHRLRALGVGPGVLVGIFMTRSLEMLVALLGTLKAGGAYVPLDPDFPAERLSFMLEDAAVPVLLTQRALSSALPAHQAELLCLDEALGAQDGRNPAPLTGPEDPAYVIYTSGSTGRPKGVQIPHRALTNFLCSMRQCPGMGSEDRLLAVTTLSFDIAGLELYLPLICGAQVDIAPAEVAADGGRLRRQLESSQITVMQATPASWRLLLEAGWQGDERLKILCGGEALPRELAKALQGRAAEVWNMYGPTETTIWSTTVRLGPGEGAVPIGRPIANTRCYVLDEGQAPLPAGEPGELYIGGEGVALGYLNRPELTAERFVPDPFSDDPRARLYRTGDLVRQRDDGALEFLGRLDHQIKLRGYRIELGEIEAVLERHPGVKQAVVTAREDRPGDQRLVAYLVAEGALGHDVLRRYVQGQLPDYMTPSAFVFLERFPLTPNNKVDRKALPRPEQRRPELEQPYSPPRGELERFLAQLWQETLNLDRVGRHDRFFELGGSSLQAAQFVNRLGRELGESLFVVSLFEHPTVAAYAEMLHKEYAAALSGRFGPVPAPTAKTAPAEVMHIDEAAVRRFEASIPRPLAAAPPEAGPKNPPALFILAPPRSGTTLLRVMLAGHPGLFAGSELQLLGFHTLAERRAAYSGKYGLWLEGALRAVMELKGCDADEAKRLVEARELQGLTTKAFYRELQSWAAPKLLVDKSPSYALDPDSLRKAERDFDRPLYIHLTRHPYAMVKSFESYRMDQVLFLEPHPFKPRQLGELVWGVSHRQILDFLAEVPADRQVQLRFEELVTRPREAMEALCERLGFDFHPGLLEPYEDLDKKMTDGLYADSRPMGDTKLLSRRGIDAGAADSWQGVERDDFLAELSWRIAERLGYARPQADGPPQEAQGEGSRRTRLERQRQLRRAHRGSGE